MEVAPLMLQFLSHRACSRDTMDSLLFQPTRFLYCCDDKDRTVFVHLGSVIRHFMYFLDQFERSGHYGRVKGRSLESLLLDEIEGRTQFRRIWEPGHRLPYQVAGRTGTDVDVFVQKGELAVMFDCKSYGVNRSYELGDGQLCWERSEQAKRWLRFAQQTAMVIAEHRVDLGLPESIRGILPFVCTGWPEFLFEPSQDYFMPDGMPRIATVREIVGYLADLDEQSGSNLLLDEWAVLFDS